MNKSALVDAVSKETGISKKLASKVIDEALKSIKTSLKMGEKALIVGFGTFESKQRKARIGRNPQTGSDMPIEEQMAITFKPSACFKDFINDKRDI